MEKRVNPTSSLAGSTEVERGKTVLGQPKFRHNPSRESQRETKWHSDRELREGMERGERIRSALEIEVRVVSLRRGADPRLKRSRMQNELG